MFEVEADGTALRDCDSRVEGPSLPVRHRTNLRAGPVTFYGLKYQARVPSGEFQLKHGRAVKTVTEVDAEEVVTVTLAASDRDALTLIYGNYGAMTSDAVRFEACPAETPRVSGRPGKTVGPRTQFNGGFVVHRPGCFEIQVATEDEASVHPVLFGTRVAEC